MARFNSGSCTDRCALYGKQVEISVERNAHSLCMSDLAVGSSRVSSDPLKFSQRERNIVAARYHL